MVIITSLLNDGSLEFDHLGAGSSFIILSQSCHAKPPDLSFTNLPCVMILMKQMVITLKDHSEHEHCCCCFLLCCPVCMLIFSTSLGDQVKWLGPCLLALQWPTQAGNRGEGTVEPKGSYFFTNFPHSFTFVINFQSSGKM